MANKNVCEVCKEAPLRYKLYLKGDVLCPYCKYVKYKEKDTTLFLCSTTCPNLYWYPAEYLSKKGDKITKVCYALEKDECFNCGKRDYPGALFVGECLDTCQSNNKYSKSSRTDMVNFDLNGQINIDPSAFRIKNHNIDDDPIIIGYPRIKIYLPKIDVDECCETFYVSYHLTLKSKKGFTMSRICHAAYQLLINSIDDIFDGKNVWKNDNIIGISFDQKTLSAYVVIDN
uniref:Uncharacterized protein n=1 Tax=viral metagenome TaxID=1070528 RepID=A0A6C0C5X3_9ZZZZ